MNKQKKIVLGAYKRLGIVFAANMIILSGMIMEFLSALAGNVVIIINMLLYVIAFALVLIPVAVSFGGMIICFASGLEKLKKEKYISATKKGKWCARWCIVPFLFCMFMIFSFGYIRNDVSVIISCVCVVFIIYDISVLLLFRRILGGLKIAEIEVEIDEHIMETHGTETEIHKMEKQETKTSENTYKNMDKMNVENGLD